MSANISLHKILFLDIETVPIVEKFEQMSETMQTLFEQKTKFQRRDEISSPEFFEERAGIFSEFAKVICISVGFLYKNSENENNFKVKSFFGEDEKLILKDFKNLLDKKYNDNDTYLCAHNGKEFDYPFLARRMIINQLELPFALDISGKKPWQINNLDTMDMWRFGDYKNFTSIKLLSEVLNIPSPKDDINGSDVARVFYKEVDLDRIARYCEKDTLTVAQIYLRMKGLELVRDENCHTS